MNVVGRVQVRPRLKRVRVLLIASLVLLVPSGALGFAPAHVIHEMVGQMLPVLAPDMRITLHLDCIFYEEGPYCPGRWHCKPLPIDRVRGRPSCLHRSGRATLEATPGPVNDGDPSQSGFVTLNFHDWGSCRLDGRVPYLFTYDVEVPGMFGHYRCVDASGVETARGLFGFRARLVGKPFYNFN